MEFEDILLEVGDKGRYQNRLILLFLLTTPFFPWLAMNIFFFISVPDHWCYVPEVASSNLSMQQKQLLISPSDDSRCQMYDVNYADVLASGMYSVPKNAMRKPCINGWEYDKTHYDYNVVTQWNLFCKDDYYPSLVFTMFSVGSMIGTTVYGSLSDRIGRKTTFLILVIVTAITSTASVLVQDFTAFIVLKTINGGLLPAIFQIPYVIVLELIAPEIRTRMNGLANTAWTIGMCFLPLVAYVSRNWITLGLATASVTILIFFYWISLPESPRWLVSQEKYEEAKVIMKRISKENGTSIDPDVILSKLKILGEKIIKEKTIDNVKNSSLDIIKYPQLRKIFIIISVCWTANGASFYGLQLNVSNLAGNEFFNFFLTSVAEIPGYFVSWFFMQRYGRRWCTVGGFLITGIACMMPAFISGYRYADIICSIIGKFSASATFMATYQQSSELYPTVVRSLGMGMSGSIASIFSLCVPYIIYLSVHGKAIPFAVISSVAFVAAFLASFLPETLNENLPQSINDAEEFGKNQKYFSWNRRKVPVSKERAASLTLQLKTVVSIKDNDLKTKIVADADDCNGKDATVTNELKRNYGENVNKNHVKV